MPFVIVTGDFVQTGGMDAANHGLAEGLVRLGCEVHLVAHRVAEPLAATPGVVVHQVPRPANSHYLGAPLLDRAGQRVMRMLAPRGAVSIINGGNCARGDITWLHYVHASHTPVSAPGVRRLWHTWKHRQYVADERRAVARARLVLANSDATRRDALDRLGARAGTAHTVYYGSSTHFFPPAPAERLRARAALGLAADDNVVTFVGALGDRRKGFDRALDAWSLVCADANWRGMLLVVGSGAEEVRWREETAARGLAARVQFLGFTSAVRDVLVASDLMIAPSRYEAYGLAVHEGVCCGLPAIASDDAGVTERFDPVLRELLVPNSDASVPAIVSAFRTWSADRLRYADAAARTSDRLRAWTWDDMAAQIMELALASARRTVA